MKNVILKPCPFCGGKAKLQLVPMDHQGRLMLLKAQKLFGAIA